MPYLISWILPLIGKQHKLIRTLGTTKAQTQSATKWASVVPSSWGGVAAGIKKISAQPTLAPKTGWSLTSHMPAEADFFLMAAPYRLARVPPPVRSNKEGFAAFSLCRVHPSSRGGDYARPKSILEKTSNDTSVSLWFRTYITRLLISPCGYGIHHGSKAPQHQHIERKIALITHDNPIGLAACTNQRGGREFDRLPQRLQLF